ncbi:MAG: hypothetical protein AAB871_01570 [Patescibacteria group bacterium]
MLGIEVFELSEPAAVGLRLIGCFSRNETLFIMPSETVGSFFGDVFQRHRQGKLQIVLDLSKTAPISEEGIEQIIHIAINTIVNHQHRLIIVGMADKERARLFKSPKARNVRCLSLITFYDSVLEAQIP